MAQSPDRQNGPPHDTHLTLDNAHDSVLKPHLSFPQHTPTQPSRDPKLVRRTAGGATQPHTSHTLHHVTYVTGLEARLGDEPKALLLLDSCVPALAITHGEEDQLTQRAVQRQHELRDSGGSLSARLSSLGRSTQQKLEKVDRLTPEMLQEVMSLMQPRGEGGGSEGGAAASSPMALLAALRSELESANIALPR